LIPARFNLPALGVTAVLLAFLAIYTPGDGVALCGFHWLTGYPCPLCGLTRALAYLVRGDWRTAVEYHALSPLVLALMIAWTRFRIPWAHVTALFLGYGLGRALSMNYSC
jgi:hypothetical protein